LFLNDVLYPEVPDYHLCFHLRADDHPPLVFSPHMEFHLLELPKFNLSVEALTTPLQKWVILPTARGGAGQRQLAAHVGRAGDSPGF
jgi:hypothetical protein